MRRARGAKRRVEVLAALGQVGAVDREAGEQLGHGVGRRVAASAARPSRGRADQLADDPPDLGAEDPVGHRALGVVDQLGPVDGRAAQPGLERVERLLRRPGR